MSMRHSAVRRSHLKADSSPCNGHASQEQADRALELTPVPAADLQSRVLLQRPIAGVETFAPGAGLGYVARRPFCLGTPLLPGASPLVGGFEFWNFRMPPAGVLVALLARDGTAAWRIRGNAGNGSRYFGLWLLPRESFAIAADIDLAFSQLTGLSFRITSNHRGHFAARFVVRSGGEYYLSRSASDRVGRFSLNGSQLAEHRWAKYSPESDLRANTSPEGWTSYSSIIGGAALLPFAFSTPELTDLQAIGLYVEAIDRSASGDRCLEWEDLQATIKKPTTLP